MTSTRITRRKFIAAASTSMAALAFASPNARATLLACTNNGARATTETSNHKPALHQNRELSLYHRHTSERITTVYWEKGEYIKENLQHLNHFFRDHRSNESTAMNIRLLDVLYLMKDTLNCAGEIHIISAYRSTATNEMLRKTSSGVAKNSFHTQGRAVDIALPSDALKKSYQMARSLKFGGAGRYGKSGFLHLDTGPVRAW